MSYTTHWYCPTASVTVFIRYTRFLQGRTAAHLHCALQVNKGTGFGQAERERLGLRGLLPAKVLTMESQVCCELKSNFQALLAVICLPNILILHHQA